MGSTILEMHSISKDYAGQKTVLCGVNLQVEKGDSVIIMGESGCGKSTLLNIIGLLDDFTSGEYVICNQFINARRLNRYNQLRAEKIGFVFQSYGLIESLNVTDNILLPFLYNKESISKDVISRLKLLSSDLGISELLSQQVCTLSGGEKQRVSICRAMIKRPEIIIADEPTGNLDETNTNLVCEALNHAASEGTAIVVVTHNRNLKIDGARHYELRSGVLMS